MPDNTSATGGGAVVQRSEAVVRSVFQPQSVRMMMVWFSIVYFPVTLLIASRKPLWNDELFTYYLANLNSVDRLWTALLTAVDQNPPVFYWLTHMMRNVPVGPLLAIRLPEILGFWLMGVCVIAFLSRHLPAVYGLVAALVVLVSGVYSYAYEARPYGLVVGFAALALVCWQRAEGAGTIRWSVGMAVSLALAVSVHYYSILVFLPLAAAEVVRWATTERAPRWPVVVSFIAGALPLAGYLPLIQSASTYRGTFWAKASIGSIGDFLGVFMVPALLPLLAIAAWATARVIFSDRRGNDLLGMPVFCVPLSQITAVAGFAVLPALAVGVALAFTGAYTHRYALPAGIGIAIVIAWMIAAAFHTSRRAGVTAAIVLSLFFVAKQLRTASWISTVANHDAISRYLERTLTGRYIVAIADPHLFLELSDQAPALRRRIMYVAEPSLALKHVGTDAVDRGVIDMSPWAPLQVKRLAEVVISEPFLVYGYPAPNGWAWLVQELSSLGVPMSVVGSFNGRLLLMADPQRRPDAAVLMPGHSEAP